MTKVNRPANALRRECISSPPGASLPQSERWYQSQCDVFPYQSTGTHRPAQGLQKEENFGIRLGADCDPRLSGGKQARARGLTMATGTGQGQPFGTIQSVSGQAKI